MGKKQHQKDKMYLTATEWATYYGGKKRVSNQDTGFRRLPHDHCALSLQPFENPVCCPQGYVFDLLAVIPFIKKYKVHPVTGKAVETKSLTKLKYHKNDEKVYHCPVTYKTFSNNTHTAAIRQTGNVYSYDAIEQLNIKTRNFKDLLTDEEFTRDDIIIIQDPKNTDKHNMENFYHLNKNLNLNKEEAKLRAKDPMYTIGAVNEETRDILNEFHEVYKPEEKKEEKAVRADKFNAAHYSTGHVSAGFTSTSLDRATQQHAAVLDEDIVRYARVKKKGYVRLITNLGPLNIELYCDNVSQASENFLKLCEKGYYHGTIFHRSIRNFIIQGGDPTGTGLGGESYWGEAFKDDFKPNLSHTGRGVLSMANAGPDTNKSQFFITYRSCAHLDPKHTIFGRVVGGMETLSAMEKIEVDNKDKPIEEIRIENTQIFTDPFSEADEQLAKEREDDKLKQIKEEETANRRKRREPANPGNVIYKKGVGKYIKPNTATNAQVEAGSKKAKPAVGYSFGDMSCW